MHPNESRPDINGQWISGYVFHDLPFEQLIIELVKPLIEQLTAVQLIDQYFFIRYWENGPHLRLRVHVKEKRKAGEVMRSIEAFTTNYFQSVAIQPARYSLEFNDYIQEIERYGGNHTIEISEIHFEDSSRIVTDLIHQNYEHWDYATAMGIAIQMHLIFAKEILTSAHLAPVFFQFFFRNWLGHSIKPDENGQAGEAALVKLLSFFENSYQQQKGKIDRLLEAIWMEDPSEEWMQIWRNSSRKLGQLLKIAQEEHQITPPGWYRPTENSGINTDTQIRWSLYESYVHMTNNRLGIHLRDEAFIAFLIFKAYNGTFLNSPPRP